jgi:type I restriction enzyme, S subunit
VFSIDKFIIDSDSFLNWMESHEAKQRINSNIQGSVRNSVVFETLCSFQIRLPNIEEQQKNPQVLSATDREIEILQQKLACLKQEKKALMQQLLTGKRRVKVGES